MKFIVKLVGDVERGKHKGGQAVSWSEEQLSQAGAREWRGTSAGDLGTGDLGKTAGNELIWSRCGDHLQVPRGGKATPTQLGPGIYVDVL